jgi:hypothetical protein
MRVGCAGRAQHRPHPRTAQCFDWWGGRGSVRTILTFTGDPLPVRLPRSQAHGGAWCALVPRLEVPSVLKSAAWGVFSRPEQAVRTEWVIALIEALLDALADRSLSHAEAYACYCRTVRLLAVFVEEPHR